MLAVNEVKGCDPFFRAEHQYQKMFHNAGQHLAFAHKRSAVAGRIAVIFFVDQFRDHRVELYFVLYERIENLRGDLHLVA